MRMCAPENDYICYEVIGYDVYGSVHVDTEIPGNIPNPGSSSKVKAKENLDDKKETLLGSMISNVSISEGSEVIGDNFHVAEIKSKDKTRPGRRRLHRNGKAWPGDELTGDNVYVSIHVGTEVKLNDETFDAKTSVVSSEESDEMIGNAVPGPVLMIQDDMLKPETSEDKAKEIVEDNKDDIRITESRSEDKVKETVGGRKETLDVKSPIISCEESKVASDGVHGSVLMDDIPKVRIKQKEFVDDNKDDIPNPGSNIEDKAKTVDDKKDNIEKELSSERRKMDITFVLPARCISYIISLTTPRDASRLSLACPAFKSAADSDSVWEKFLPSDYKEIISNSSSISASSLMITSLSKKDLYFYLCHNPILINNHTTSFSLVQETGKKCYMVGARGLSIAWGDSPQYWNWLSLQESRFPEVAKLREVWWFEIIARIETRILSSKTNYGAYLVFKFVKSRQGFDARPIEFDVYFEGSNNHKRRSALLDPPTNVSPQLSQDRGDGWTEIEMGEFFNENGDDGTVVCKLCESGSVQKRGIIIQGIELRPKYGK
ncbi:F-box protein PP2-B10 [Citrus sinensis]|nr:F-box protein PP2-B10 [Citrus sinensis]